MTIARPHGPLTKFRDGPLASFLADGPVLEIGAGGPAAAAAGSQASVLAAYRLQDAADYRATLQSWFALVRPGGHLIVVVPHAFLYERQLALPSRWHPAQRRLYTPRSLLDEVEEALAPNSYRLRFLGDDDAGYDYALASDLEPIGHSDILLAIEKIALPEWKLETPVTVKAAAPDYAFEPARTRIEVVALRPRRKILILKLDHLGDFIMGIPALERARAAFADAEITLAVGSWNVPMARELGLADRVAAFDAFPRNSSEEEVDVPGKAGLFRAAFPNEYDLAIDLRTDIDTRVLLRNVRAAIKAGIGTRARFPFLDIFLPIDSDRNEPETAREDEFNHHAFASQGSTVRSDYRIASFAAQVERDCAIVWGPYRPLRPGRYFFEPHLEIDRSAGEGVLLVDVALDTVRVASTIVPSRERVRLRFEVDRPGAEFEFRIWTVDDLPSADLSYFGGRLVREGAASVLHQSEYLGLLIELIAMRLDRGGMLVDAAAA